MKSFRRRRYGQAEALIDARNKAFNIVMAVLLVFTMLPVTAFTYESQASAEPLNNEQIDTYSDDGSSSNQDGDNGSSGGSSTGGNNATGGDNGTPGGSSSESGSGSGGSSDNGSGDGSDDGTGSNSGSSSDGNNASSGNGNQGNQNGSSDGNGTSDKGDQSGSSSNNGNSDNSGTTDENDGSNSSEDDDTNNDSKDPSESEEDEDQRDPFAWQSKLDACDLGAKLTVETSEIESLENDELPSTIPATFRVDFKLNPGEDKLLVDDWIKTTLPNFLTFENATYEVFRLNEDGTDTAEKIADAKVENGKLKITFVEAGATEDTNAVVRGFVDLKATFSSALLGDDQELKQTWTAQTAEDGTENNVDVVFPAKQAVVDAWHAAHNIINDITGINKGEVEAQESANAADDEISTLSNEEITYSVSNYSASDQMTITWCDNNYEGRPAPNTYNNLMLPQYSLDGGKTWETLINSVTGEMLDTAKEDFGITGDTPSWAKRPTIAQTTVGNWNVSISGLPTTLTKTTKTPTGEYDEHGNPTYTEEKESTEIQWRLYDANKLPDGYIYGDNDGGPTGDENKQNGQRYLMRTHTYTFTISGKLGDLTLKEAFGDFTSGEYAQYFTFGASINNVQQGQPVTLSQMMTQYDDARFKIEYSEDGKTATVTAVMPMYDVSGAPIVYDIKYTEEQGGETDYYQPAYNNSASPSHGSATDALYSGGTLTLRPMGLTTYDATKVWLDGDNQENRPETTFTLWRYSTNGSSVTAAQVQLNATDQASNPNVSNDAVQYVSITVPEGSSNSVDLGKLLNENYGNGTQDFLSSLPKYDPDGYPYIYALREDTSLPGYERVYGSVAGDDTVTDTAPNYQDANGNRVNLSAANRDNDPLIYNGGTLTNRLTGQVRVEATKTWEIAAFQDSLDNVVVTFTLQSRIKDSNDQWQDTDKTIDVDGWKSETLTQTFGDNFPQYNAQGKELEYRWIETGVSVDGKAVEFTCDGNGGGSFTMTLKNIEGEDDSLDFTSAYTEAVDDNSLDTITNTFANVTEEHVDKFWEQPDGSMAQIKPQEGAYDVDHEIDLNGIATVQLFQDGKLIGTFDMDGTTDLIPTKIENLSGDATVQETSSYHLDFNNLPKYSSDGVRHVYLVLETQKTGWHVDRIYDAETHTTTFNNTIGDGEGSEIRLLKNWVDGDDSSHRLTVEVELVALHDMQSNATDAEGKPKYSYKAGETVLTTTLSAANSWYAEVDVPIGGKSYRDFKLVETALIVENDDGTTTRYPVVNNKTAATEYADINIDKNWINEGWDYDSTENTWRVATPDHVYQVYANPDAQGEWNDDMDAVTSTNRRLGLFDLTITKTWKDGVHHERPNAELVVSCVEEQGVFEIDNSGNVWAQLDGGSRVPVMNGDGEDARQLNSVTDNITLEGDNLVVKVSTPEDENYSEFKLFGLPKYNGSGVVVHYDVTERVSDDSHEYSTTKTVGVYKVGSQHFHDIQQIDFTNNRQATRDVIFNKHWYDHYVNDTLSQRPDIYLTLYRVTVEANEDGSLTFSDAEQVPGYVHYLWTGVADSENPQYEQTCTIANLPAYDADGNEYVYYASESMSADGTALDYAPCSLTTQVLRASMMILMSQMQ